ncbi:MAG: GGDEF domain-containing protein [Oscillospiraceae bacterium]|nr:GGDEF domain-containing protein [Oscillospiraceae bacterium]
MQLPAHTAGNVTTDAHFHMEYADAAYFHYFGDDVVYSILRTVHEADTERLLSAAASLRDGQTEQIALRMRGCSTDWRWMLVSLTAHGDDESRQYHFCISDARGIQRALLRTMQENTEYRFYLNLMRDLAFHYSFRTKRIRLMAFDCCREIVLTDMLLEEWKQQAIGKGMIGERDVPQFEKLCADIAAGTSRFQCELETSVCSLGARMEYCAFRGVTRANAPGSRTVLGTISFLHAKYKSKEPGFLIESSRDPATDLLNKSAVTAYAKEVLAAQPAETVSLVLLNIDDFKEINDRWGHMFGDEVLFTLSHILKTEIGARGTAGRIGGGSFLLVLEGIADETDLRGILRAIRTKLEWAWESGTGSGKAQQMRVTCSMGAACYPIDAKTYEELFMQADKALYIAREKGHNRYVIYDVKKHGEVQPNRARSLSDLYAAAPPQSNTGFVTELVQEMMHRKPPLSEVLERIGTQFGLDGITVFTAPDWQPQYRWGHPIGSGAEILIAEPFAKSYSAERISVIDNINALEGIADDAFQWMQSENLQGAVLYRAEDAGTPTALIAFGLFGRYRKWSTPDIGHLTVLGGVLHALLTEGQA